MDAYTRRPRRPFYLDVAARKYAIEEVQKNSKSGRELDPTMFERVLTALERHLLLGKTHKVALQLAVEEEQRSPEWQGLYKMGVGYYRDYRRKCNARGKRARGTVPEVPPGEVITLIEPDGQERLI